MDDEKWIVGLDFCKGYDNASFEEFGTLRWLFCRVITDGPKEYGATPEDAKYYKFAKPLTMDGIINALRALADDLEKQNDGR